MSRTLGIIGSGMIGTAVARLAVAAGHDVVVSNSRGPETLTALVAELGEHARAATSAEAARAGDLVVAAIPLSAFGLLPVDVLAGKVVLDTANYYPERDGHLAELDASELTSSALLQRHLAGSQVVKAFNTITAPHLLSLARPADDPDRSALPIAGDDIVAKAAAIQLLDVLGFDAVDTGALAESWRSEPNTAAYVSPYLGVTAIPSGEEFFRLVRHSPGVAVPSAQVARLIETAVRQSPGETRLPRAD